MKTLPVLLPLVVLICACTKDPAPPPVPPAEQKPATEKKPDTDQYNVALVARGPYAAGQAASAIFTVAAKPGYHVNPEYPMVFKPQGHSGVQFAEERLKLTWGQKTPCAEKPEDACAVEVPIALTPEKAGPAVVAGLVAFSVCNPQHCLIEKLPLSLSIDVK
jgi:hypothetical protein